MNLLNASLSIRLNALDSKFLKFLKYNILLLHTVIATGAREWLLVGLTGSSVNQCDQIFSPCALNHMFFKTLHVIWQICILRIHKPFFLGIPVLENISNRLKLQRYYSIFWREKSRFKPPPPFYISLQKGI